MSTAVHFVSLRRSGTHPIAGFIQKATNTKLWNNQFIQHFIEAEKEGRRLLNSENSLIIYEDHSPWFVSQQLTEHKYFQKAIGTYDKHVIVVNFRDCYNLFASRIKHWDLMSSEGKHINTNMLYSVTGDFLKLYIENATLPQPTCKVKYNSFIENVEERKELYDFLERKTDIDLQSFEKADESLNEVDVNGNGSSFVGRKKRDNYHNGYEYYSDLEVFRNIFTEPLINANKTIFNFECPWVKSI